MNPHKTPARKENKLFLLCLVFTLESKSAAAAFSFLLTFTAPCMHRFSQRARGDARGPRIESKFPPSAACVDVSDEEDLHCLDVLILPLFV